MSEETTVVEEKAVETTVEETKVEATEPEAKEAEVKSEETKPEAEAAKGSEPEKKSEGGQQPGRWQKRVNQLTKKVYELQSQLSAAQQVPLVKPERASYQSDEQYIEALTDHKIAEKLPQLAKKMESGSIEQKFQKNEETLRGEIEDYDDVISDRIEFPHQSTIDAIVESDYGPRIRYYLGTHPEETEALLSMSAAAASRTIGKIESKIEAEMEAKKNPPAQQVSKAKPPIKPVHAAGAPVKVDPNKLSDSEWFKREQELRKQKFKT
jgi:hypothetical protein